MVRLWIAGAIETRERILDAGTGTGWTARRVQTRGARVTGIDIGAGVIEAATELDTTGTIDFRVADAEAMAALPDGALSRTLLPPQAVSDSTATAMAAIPARLGLTAAHLERDRRGRDSDPRPRPLVGRDRLDPRAWRRARPADR